MVRKKYKHKLNHSLRIAKRIYYGKKIDASKSNGKATWRVLNEIIKTKKKAFKINSIFKVSLKKSFLKRLFITVFIII